MNSRELNNHLYAFSKKRFEELDKHYHSIKSAGDIRMLSNITGRMAALLEVMNELNDNL